jgi:hypothetical protein
LWLVSRSESEFRDDLPNSQLDLNLLGWPSAFRTSTVSEMLGNSFLA